MTTATIQGVPVGSQNELNTAQALYELKLTFDYQVNFGGGRVLGGQVIDFVVHTKPLPTPVFVQGSYWHGGKKAMESRLKMWQVEAKTRGYWAKPVELTEEETSTLEQAKEAIKGKVM